MTTAKWTDERTQQLKDFVGVEKPITARTVEKAAEALDTSSRSIAAKLRKLGYEVASLAKAHTSAFTQDEANALSSFVTQNANQYTYTEIAETFASGKFNAKQIQGKILSLELTGMVKPTEKVEAEIKTNVLKPWILPSGNEFIKDPSKRYKRPEGNPGENPGTAEETGGTAQEAPKKD